MKTLALCAACSMMLPLAACNDRAQDPDDRIEAAAEASAVQAGPEPVALGLSEAQLLEADLVGANGIELGDVAGVLRSADGAVDRLLVEIEDSNPDRFVAVPVAGLNAVVVGDDTDLSSAMTPQQLAALPDAQLTGS